MAELVPDGGAAVSGALGGAGLWLAAPPLDAPVSAAGAAGGTEPASACVRCIEAQPDTARIATHPAIARRRIDRSKSTPKSAGSNLDPVDISANLHDPVPRTQNAGRSGTRLRRSGQMLEGGAEAQPGGIVAELDSGVVQIGYCGDQRQAQTVARHRS